jgi:ribosomal protein S27AE
MVGGARVWRFKSCPKCKGDVILGNKDRHGWYEQCLQCGYVHDLQTIVEVETQLVKARKKIMVGGPKKEIHF